MGRCLGEVLFIRAFGGGAEGRGHETTRVSIAGTGSGEVKREGEGGREGGGKGEGVTLPGRAPCATSQLESIRAAPTASAKVYVRPSARSAGASGVSAAAASTISCTYVVTGGSCGPAASEGGAARSAAAQRPPSSSRSAARVASAWAR